MAEEFPGPEDGIRVLPPEDQEQKALSPEQAAAVDLCLQWLAAWRGGARDKQVFSLSGIAGSGKTFTSGELIKALQEHWPGIRIAYLGTTHRARIQLGFSILDALDFFPDARTVHSAVFETDIRYFCLLTPTDDDGEHEEVERIQREAPCEACAVRDRKCRCTAFVPCSLADAGYHLACVVDEKPVEDAERPEYPYGTVHLIYVDEASMLTRRMLRILTSWELPVVIVGDHRQIEPVRRRGRPDPEREMCDEIRTPDVFLDRPMRQKEGSALFDVATRMRHGQDIGPGKYGEKGREDVLVLPVPSAVTERDLDDTGRMRLAQRLLDFGTGGDRVVITPWNPVRQAVNRLLHRAHHHPRRVLVPGDRVRCVKPWEAAYAVPWHVEAADVDLREYHREYREIADQRRPFVVEIRRLERMLTAARKASDRMDTEFLTSQLADLRARLTQFPEGREVHTFTHDRAVVERVEPDPEDGRGLYALLRLADGFPWPYAWSQVVVRLAAEQLGFCAQYRSGYSITLPKSRRLPGAVLWDYAYCLSAHASQGGEWDTVLVLGPGWPEDYDRMGYVAASRAKRNLTIMGDKHSDKGQFLHIAALAEQMNPSR